MQNDTSTTTPLSRARKNKRAPWVLALAAQLIMLPVVPASIRGEAPHKSPTQVAPRAADDAPSPSDPSAARFRRIGTKHLIRGKSGFKMTTSLGRWRAAGLEARGAKVEMHSPWGEKLRIDLVINDFGMLATFNDKIQAFTLFDTDHNPYELQVTVDGLTTTSHLGDSARRFASGGPLPDLDSRAHQTLAMALQNELSPAFFSELAQLDPPVAEVGCLPELALCIGSIVAWAIDVALLPGACLVLGVPTFGVSCALAVIGHQLASANVAYSCKQYADCREHDNVPPEEPDESTPIILDMDGRGLELTGLDEPVVFDLTADGIPDRVSWTRRDGDEAFLVFDRNRNGRIDDGSELFGSRSPLVDGALAEHGFVALTEYDLRPFGGNENGRIDAGDKMFARLMLWNDRDRNGVSDRKELRTLRQAGVVSLSLDYKVDGRQDRHGNKFVVNGEAMVRVRGYQQTRTMSDVYLRIQQ